MPISQQVLHEASFAQLKGLADLECVSFDTTPLVSITGANGCGKSTILHALACAYRPDPSSNAKNYKFPQFFLPTTDSKWEGSSFSIKHSYRDGHAAPSTKSYSYGKASDRWTPRYENRPVRFVDYIGISTCVPSIEQEYATSYLELTSVLQDDDLANSIRSAASKILNRSYTSLSKRTSGARRKYRGVQFAGIDYSSLSMGAGEQRIFEIIERVYTAPKHSLILIDEIDLLLHEDALQKLLTVLNERASGRSQQIIFTTHRESVLARSDITAHHLFKADGRTLTMPSTHPDVWHRLTGESVRSLEVFVEDDLAQAVVAKIAAELKIRKHVQIVEVGAAINLFTLASGLSLRGEALAAKAFVLDGDVYRMDSEKRSQISRVLTGHGSSVDSKREAVLGSILQFDCPIGYWPEKALHELLTSAEQDPADEVVEIARTGGVPMEKHRLLNDLVARLGDSRETGIHKLVEVASRATGWREFTSPVRAWLDAKRIDLGL